MDNINDCFGLAGRVCVVTGGGSGIGQGVAVALAGEGAKVALLDVNDAGNEETLALIARNNGTAMAQRCDVSKLDSIEAAHESARASARRRCSSTGPASCAAARWTRCR